MVSPCSLNRRSMVIPELAEDEVMHSQALNPGGNADSIREHPPSDPTADDNIPAQETHVGQIGSQDTETSIPLPIPGHGPTLLDPKKSRLYALIIGIDGYSSVAKLAGAVNDAKAVEEFLKSRMNVPLDRIRLLVEHDASRRNIIEALTQLSREEKIEMDDPILIYYAGHGVQLRPPPNWEAGGAGRKIQGICPYNYEPRVVRAIPDRTIGVLLDLICEKKGNNVTVIFDCCHSSSGTRIGELTTDIRGVVLDDVDELPFDLDLPELSTLIPMSSDSRVGTRFGRRGLASHVLIAACKEKETAKEVNGRGQFTEALLELLSEEGRMETLTYTDILKHIRPIQFQNPQVEGIHRDRILFNAKVARRRPFYSVRLSAQIDTFIMDAGSVHGIATGSQFTIYEDHDSFLKSKPWGSLLVSNVMKFSSQLQRSEGALDTDLEKPGIAVLSAGGTDQALTMTASYDPSELPLTFLHAIERMKNQHMISLVDENAEVEMQLEDGQLVFNILDPSVNACGLDRVYYTALPTDTAEDVARILSAGCSFFWHFRRGHADDPIVDDLTVEFMELKVSENKPRPTDYSYFSPSENNLLRENRTIDLDVNSTPKPYGIRITNNSELDLFPAAFYFDHSDWSIDEYYHPGTAGQFDAEVPLRKRGGTLTIGYGAGGHDPISFRLNRKGQDLDVGHLKIFFSTKPVDLRLIQQESPFTRARKREVQAPVICDTWVSLQYPIIQRRP